MKNKPEIVLIGGGGHCKACIDIIEIEAKYQIAGIVDTPEKKGQSVLGYPIIGNDNDIERLATNYDHFLITIGHIKSPIRRINLFDKMKNLKKDLPIIISPNAYVSRHSFIGAGTIIMHNVIVNAGASIGENCIINNKALIEHDSKIGSHCHISTNAIVNGNCMVNEKCFIGSSSVLIHDINIAKESIIGAGSVVTKDINISGLYFGNNAKRILK